MTRTLTDTGARRPGFRAGIFVLGGLGLAALYTAAALALDAGGGHIGPVWLAAIAWTVAASLAGALWQGFRHRNWSAFGRHEFPGDDGDADEWASRTGRYAWLGDMEDRLHDNDHLRDHSHG